MTIVDIAQPSIFAPVDTPKGFAVTPGKDDVDHGSEAPGTGKVIGAAFRLGNTISAALSREYDTAIDDVEDGFSAWDRIKDTKYERHWESFVRVRNSRALSAMQRQIDREEEDQRILRAAPWYKSMPAQLAAGFFDLPSLIPGSAFVRGVRGGISVTRAALGVGAAAGVSTTAQELALQRLQQTRELSESATNIGASVFLGGLLGPAGAKLLKNAEWKRSSTALDRDVNGYPAVATGDARYTATESGRRFVKLEDGSDEFGNVTPAIAREARLESGPIRLPEGFQTPEGRGAGELHIEANRGAQLRALGHKDAAEFVKSVTSGFDEIYADDRSAILLVKRNGDAPLAVVSLQPSERGGWHWEVITAFVSKGDPYLKNRTLLWSRPRPDDISEAAQGSNASGLVRTTAGAADEPAGDVAHSVMARDGAVSGADNGVSSAHGGRTREAEGVRDEGPRQATDTRPGADHVPGREGQAAPRAAGRSEPDRGVEGVASRDDRGGAAGGRRGADEALVPGLAADLADAGRVAPDQDGSRLGRAPAGRPSGPGEAVGIDDGRGNRQLPDRLPVRGRGGADEAGHAGVEAPTTGNGKEIAEAGPPQKPGGPPRESIPPDGTKSSHEPPEAAPGAASSRQEQLVDQLLAAHPDPERDVPSWRRMVEHVFGRTRLSMVPDKLLGDIHGNGATETLKRLTPEQIAAADHGLAQARTFREAYTSGNMSVVRTGKLVLWSFLSRGRSPYAQESMFIDAFKGIDEWVEKAAKGSFTDKDLEAYKAWAKSVAPAKSGQPGAQAAENLIQFGQYFLSRMSKQNANGVTHLQRLHELLSDPNMTGQQIRREFLTFGEGSGVSNKVMSLTLQMAGHVDVMVLDRVQIQALFSDGVSKNVKLYESLLGDARGLLIYEAIERALAKRVDEFYAAAGRPDGASIGRYHWETWQAHSRQEASHETLRAILPHTGNKGIADVRVRQGKYSNYEYGASYGVDESGVPYYTYPKLSGGVHVFSVRKFRDFLAEIKEPSSGVVKPGFKITKDGDINVPWFERQGQGVDRQRLDDIASQRADGGDVGRRVPEDPAYDQVAGGSFRRAAAGGRKRGGVPVATGAEEVTSASLPQKPAEPPDRTTSISSPDGAANQAALSHPEQADLSGDAPRAGGDGKVRSVAAAGLAATGLAAASMDRGGSDPDDDTLVVRAARALRRLSPLERIMQSPNAAAREAGVRLFENPQRPTKRFEDVGFDASAETLMKDWNDGLTRALKGTKDAFSEHWKAAGRLDEREFNEAVGRALRNSDVADDPQAARAAKLWGSDVFGPITEAAVQAGLLPDGVNPAAAGSYFSRQWSRSKLFAMEREFKETVAQYVAERMARGQGTGGGTDIRAKAREIAEDLFDTLTGRSESGPRPGQDGSVYIPDALAAPFLEDDIELIGRRVVRSIGADLELAQKFGTPDMAGALQGVRDEYEQRRAAAADDNERLALTRAEKKDIADLEAVRDRIRGTRIEGAIERNYARVVRAAEHLDAMRATGEAALASLPDAIRPAMVQGLSAYMQTVDRLAADLEAVRMEPGEAALAGQVAGRVLAHRLSALAGIDDPYASRTPADAFLQKMTDTGSSWNGVRMFADMQKSFAAVMVQDRILNTLQERAELSGISAQVSAQIAGQFETYGQEIEGVRVANTQAWDKDDATATALRAFRAAVNKDMASFIATDTPTGAAMLALKNFALASYQRLLLRGLDAKAERFVGGLIAMTALGMFVAWTASPDVATDAERWIGEGFDRSGIMAVPLELSDAFEKATGFDPLGPVKSPQSGTRLLPFNAYPGIRAMLRYALHPHN